MCSITLSDLANILSIGTPVILFIWFLYSRKGDLAKAYFEEVAGIYAGYTQNFVKPYEGSFQSGIILNIKDVQSNGFFTGNIDSRQIDIKENAKHPVVSTGIFSFYGRIKHRFSFKLKTHPFNPKRNRIYKGVIYVVHRLDINIENQTINTYLRAEYNMVHYRESGVIKFTLKKKHSELLHLPTKFILHKKRGLTFEPYTNVKESIFGGITHSDKE